MPQDRKKLDDAKKAKNDEFYTLYEDISAEVSNYKKQLKGKRILCPCDWDESYNEEIVFKEENYIPESTLFGKGTTIKNVDIEKSKAKFEKDLNNIKCNFVKFLVSHADDYGIKSVSVSGYNPNTQQGIRFQDIDYSRYDLVITNPPFSQFREFIETMFANKMEFLVIGPLTAISYKEIFPCIKNNQMWLGYNDVKRFLKPNGEFMKFGNISWYTNLDVLYRHDRMILTAEYDADKYPHYDNYDAIDVNKTKLIPQNYDGYMGVPITFMQKYNPEQFEIICFDYEIKQGLFPDLINKNWHDKLDRGYINGTRLFARIIIKRK